MSIVISDYYKNISQNDCLEILEEIIWNNKPRCPYCESHHHTILKNENRYRCNSCHTAYSITVNTLFHDTRLPLKKWFTTVHILQSINKEISSRELAQILSVNKNTAWYLIKRIENGFLNTKDRQLILSLSERLRGQNEK